MRGFRTIINQVHHLQSNVLLVAAVLLLGVGLAGVLGIGYSQADAAIVRNCDNNAIMYCGAETAAEFKQKYDENKPGDLKAIYDHYWIPRDIQVVQGQSFKDGTVRVNGRVVATGAQSIGREAIPGSRPITIAGKTYYETPNSAAFKTDGLPTLVALDAQGNFKYAIISGCGNPVYAKPVPPKTPEKPKEEPKPAYACEALKMDSISTTKKRFTVTASASGGASITGYRIDLGDGNTKDGTSRVFEHEYANAGNYTAKATALVKVGNETKEAAGAKCTVSVTIEKPGEAACVALNVIKRSSTKYDFSIQKTETNATYKGATMDYGDGQSEQITGTTASHEYAKAGNYTVTATLKFDINGSVVDKKCTAQITAEMCPYDSNLPKDSPDCVAPAAPVEMPKTGAGGIIMSGVGLVGMIAAGSFYFGSRRDLLAAFLSR